MNPERRLDLAAAFASAAVIAAGVLFFGWPAFAVLAFYWIENVVIGVFNLVRMGIAGWRVRQPLGTLFIGAFFVVHYGMFCAGHALFLMALFGPEGATDSLTAAPRALFLSTVTDGIAALVVLMMIVNAALDTLRWRATLEAVPDAGVVRALMGEPYGRIVVLHVVLLGGGFLLQVMHAPAVGALLLIAAKLAYDVHRLRRAPDPDGAQRAPDGIWKD